MVNVAAIVAGPAIDLIDKAIPDAQGTRDNQSDQNDSEAKSSSLFVSGWRPFIGWAIGTIILWNFIVAPLLVWISALLGSTVPNVPSIPIEALVSILVGMLGLGGFRTVEKLRGATR